ncbi:MAG TPA: hypothetical protein VKM93_02040 [Terriglobia bacterium]|nr:hypothetical protein [Terriglobia bacterium]
MADSNGNLDRKIESSPMRWALDGAHAQSGRVADLLVRSVLLRQESTRLADESEKVLEEVDRFFKAVSRREQYRRNAASLRGFLLWEDAT